MEANYYTQSCVSEKKKVRVHSFCEEEVCMCVTGCDTLTLITAIVLQCLLPRFHDLFIHLWKGKTGLESQSILVSFINVTKAI